MNTAPQTQGEQIPAPPRRMVASSSSLLAVMILLSMLPPGAGIVAASALADEPTRITLGEAGVVHRRDARNSRILKRSPSANLSKAMTPGLIAPGGHAELASRSPAIAIETRIPSPREQSGLRDALLALPPPFRA